MGVSHLTAFFHYLYDILINKKAVLLNQKNLI